MNKSVSNKDLNKTMAFILNHKSLSNKDIDELTSTSKSRNAITVLKAMKAIDYNISMSGNYYNFRILDDGILYFYRKKQQRAGFWKGFLTGIISTVSATLIVNLIMLCCLSPK